MIKKMNLSRFWFWGFAVLLSVSALLLSTAYGVSDCTVREVDKARRVEELLMQHPLHMSRVTRVSKNVAFCNTFLDDFKLRRKTKHIEPVLCTNAIDDPRLRHYRSCINYDHPSDVGFDVRYYDLSELGDQNFRLYRQGTGELGEVIYAEIDPKRPPAGRVPGYSRINLQSCTRLDLVPVAQSGSPFTDFRRENYNGLLDYADSYVVFSLEDLRGYKNTPPAYQLRVFRYDHGAGFKPVCRWTFKQDRSSSWRYNHATNPETRN